MARKPFLPAFHEAAWVTRPLVQSDPVARPYYEARDEADAWLALNDPRHPNARRASVSARSRVRAEHKRQVKQLAIATVPDVLDRSQPHGRMALPSIHEEEM